MTMQERLAEQRRVRHKLLENGYSPLPLINKMCLEKGWPALHATPELIDRWARKTASQTTGMRIDGRLIALDFDIDSVEMMDEIADRAVEISPAFDLMPARFGGGTAKQTWLARLDDASLAWPKYRSKTYVSPDDDPTDERATRHALELFSSGSAVQIGAYGVHTPGEDKHAEPVRNYRWATVEGKQFDPLTTPLAALPVVTRDQIERLVDIVHEVADELGFQQVRSIPSGTNYGGSVYDLSPSMEFRCADGVTRQFEQLRDYATNDWSARCDAHFIDPASVNTQRCSVRIDHEDKVYVYDFMTYSRHYHFAERGKSLGEMGALIRDRIIAAEFMSAEEFESATAAQKSDFEQSLGICHASYAVNPAAAGGRGGFLRLDGVRELDLMPSGLRMKFAPWSLVTTGKKGGKKTYNPADAFMMDRTQPRANGYRFMPDQPPGIIADGKFSYINTHIPPDRHLSADWEDQQQVFLDFLDHLLPIQEERDWFLKRLAHKAQNLGVPGLTTIITTGKEGTGRNTLFDMLSAAFGHNYTSIERAEDILGTGAQSHFNGWMCDKHFVFCSELMAEAGDTMSDRSKKKVLEHMKERMEPAPMFQRINFKGAANQREWITTSYILATNHLDALPLDNENRRFAVLRGAKVKLDSKPTLLQRIVDNRVSGTGPFTPAFGAALWKLLEEMEIGDFNAQTSVDFGGKEAMARASRDELDDLVEQVLEANPYGWGLMTHLVDQVQRANARREFSIDGNPAWHRRAIKSRIKSLWPATHDSRVRIGDRLGTIVARDDDAVVHVLDELTPEERAHEAAWAYGFTAPTPAAFKVVK